MRLFGRGLFVVCAVVATLLLSAGGVAGLGHSDCEDADVACVCACHDTTALYSRQDVFIPHGSAEIVCEEVEVVDFLIPHDIFRPPPELLRGLRLGA